tara:strand:+ start:269 stop:460 length:192 start_codon:yes stop_codon:yes gene_type:complete
MQLNETKRCPKLFGEIESLKAKNQGMNEKLLQLPEKSKRKKILVYSLFALLLAYFVLTKLLMK